MLMLLADMTELYNSRNAHQSYRWAGVPRETGESTLIANYLDSSGLKVDGCGQGRWADPSSLLIG